MAIKWLVLGRIFLDSSPQNYAAGDVTHPARVYVGRILSWGMIDRSIPVPSGLPQVSDAKVRIADTDRQLRDVIAAGETPLRRRVQIKIVEEGASEAAADPVFTGEIVDFEFGPGYAEMSLRDPNWSWIDEEIPNLITKDNYPDLEETNEAFLPIVVGINDSPTDLLGSPPLTAQGQIACPHINWGEHGSPPTLTDRYAAAATPIDSIVVYRKRPDEDLFSVVDIGEYAIVEDPITLLAVDLTPTYIDFADRQAQGTLIRGDIHGINARGNWGSLPVVTGELLRNPIDFFINMTFFIMKKAGTKGDLSLAFDTEAIIAVREKFETVLTEFSPPTGYLCDGAITQPISVREWLARFLSSFNLDLFQNRHGQISLGFSDETDPDRPTFKEGYIIVRNSFSERLASPTANQIRYQYNRYFAMNEWSSAGEYNNTADQDALARPVLDADNNPVPNDSSPWDGEFLKDPKIQTDDFELWFVRDPVTAVDVVSRRASFLALGSYRQQWTMPAPEVFDNLELAKLVGITHSQGLAIGGYINQETKITGLSLDLDSFAYTVRSILRVPMTVTVPTPPINFRARLSFEMLGSEIFGDDATTDYYATELPAMGDSNQPGVEHAWWEVILSTYDTGSGDYLALVDEDDSEYARIDPTTDVDPANYNLGYIRVRKEFTFPATAKKLHVKMVGAASGLVQDFFTSRVLLDVVDPTSARVQIPMIVQANSTAGFDSPNNDKNLWCAARSGGCNAGADAGVYGLDNYSVTNCVAHGYVHSIFKKEESRYATIDHWELDVTASLAFFGIAGTGHVALFNKTTDSMVSGTEQSFTSLTQQERKTISFSNIATNFDDGDEFEVRFKVTGQVGPNYAVITIARADLYVVLSPPSKALLYHRIGSNNVPTNSAAGQVDDTCRWLHEDDPYLAGFTAFHEATAYQFQGVGRHSFAMDVEAADIGGNTLKKFAGAQAIGDGSALWDADDGSAFGTSGHNTIGTADNGCTRLRMTNNGTLAGVAAQTTLADGTIVRMRLSAFGFDGLIPGTASIISVIIDIVKAFTRILFTSNSFVTCSGFTTTGAMTSKGRAVLGGSPQTEHSASESNATVVSGTCASHVLQLDHRTFTITSDHAWAPSDFDDGNFNVDVGAAYVSSGNRMIEALFDAVSVTVVYGETAGDLNATSSTRQTLRTAAITLTDQHRYLMYQPLVAGNNAYFVQSWLLIQIGNV